MRLARLAVESMLDDSIYRIVREVIRRFIQRQLQNLAIDLPLLARGFKLVGSVALIVYPNAREISRARF